ncbi:MAG: polyprenyl synthetase family protein [Planctomycetota bacterium]
MVELSEDTLAAPAQAVDAALASFLDGTPMSASLRDAIRYATLGGGKRIRPVLCWHWARGSGGEGRDALPAACALELVHAFSLVHDDLPAMDDDDLRRGRPTLHRHANEAMAILAGDAMLNLATRSLLEATGAPRLIEELSEATVRMIDGQVFDTMGFAAGDEENSGPDERRLRAVHKNKTGALIRAACRMGVLSAGGDRPPNDETLEAATAYADAIGLMFQIVDDLLDAEGDEAATGKRTGKDAAAGKLTFPGVLGAESSRAEVASLLDQALKASAKAGPASDDLGMLARALASRDR